MKHILYIVGQTATGKTDFAISCAKKYNGEIINADSRQFYKGMNIGTGKDLEELEKSHVSFHLFNEIFPNEEWSVSQAVTSIQSCVKDIWKRGKLPIIVGGTGQYASYVESQPESLTVPRDEALRKEIEGKEVVELQTILSTLNNEKLFSMNNSDKMNKRRLIRAIEVETYKKDHPIQKQKKFEDHTSLWIGFTTDNEKLEKRIEKRIEKRLIQGMLSEVQSLIDTYGDFFQYQAFTATGYRECKDFLEKKITKKELISLWKTHELQYAKRQMTWFKKQKNIYWISVDNESSRQTLESYIKNWYDESYERHTR